MPFKDFAAGAVLTAAEVDTYLMRQTVMTFATAAARDTALTGVLDEGMVCYIEDTDRFAVYTGAAWRAYASTVYTAHSSDTPTSDANGICTVAFGTTFASAPIVYVTNGDDAAIDVTLHILTTTTTGFTARARKTADGTAQASTVVRINWIAIGPLAG